MRTQPETFKIAFNLEFTGKVIDEDAFRKFNGTFSNLDLSPADIALLISRGHAYTTHHAGYRNMDNFKCGQHLSLDFDSGDVNSSFLGILRDDFIRHHAYMLYTTPSHSIKNPRARALFLLNKPITKVSAYSELTTALVHKYINADRSCKDPVRPFFGGATNGNFRIKILGNILSLSDALKKIIVPFRTYQEIRREKRRRLRTKMRIVTPESQEANGAVDKIIETLLDNVLYAPDGEKHTTLNIIAYTMGGYVAGGYISQNYAETILYDAIAARPSVKSLRLAQKTIQAAIQRGMSKPIYLEVYKNSGDSYVMASSLKEAGIVL